MTLTVVLPVYNGDNASYLRSALESIYFGQTRKPDEVVVVVDGPINIDLKGVIEEFRCTLEEDKVIVIFIEKNQGLAHALNVGIKAAKGDLIARMDADDLSLGRRFELQIEQFSIDENLAILGGAIEVFTANDETKIVYSYPPNAKEMLRYIYRQSPFAHPTVMFRRALILDLLYSESKHHLYNEDLELWGRLIKAGYVMKNLDIPILAFRISDGFFDRRSLAKATGELRLYFGLIRELHGFNVNMYVVAFARFLLRLLPVGIVRYAYKRRNKFLKAN
jgi:glycosyltransferase involved in cell wall biosynthesis